MNFLKRKVWESFIPYKELFDSVVELRQECNLVGIVVLALGGAFMFLSLVILYPIILALTLMTR